MSRESLQKIKEAEETAERIVSDAKRRGGEIEAEAEQKGKEICRLAQEETAKELASIRAAIVERTEQVCEKMNSESVEETEEIRRRAKLRMKVAEKMIIRGLDSKCR